MKTLLTLALISCTTLILYAQPNRWQQRAKYNINIDVDVVANQFSGVETIDYLNNSPDTLYRMFFHLYWNAFQPNSMMDVKNRVQGNILLGHDRTGIPLYDWDLRIKDRISRLTPTEIGYQQIQYVRINGIDQKLSLHETILKVIFDKPLLPKSKTTLEVAFKAQVPVQIRRSGRDNAEGVRFSMSQWYPKIAEYDHFGWHASPYVAEEFYGVWGDFDVNINIDKAYMLAATGILQNAHEVGFGYEPFGVNVKSFTGEKITWKFSAQNVHDFVWAADPDYTMIKHQIKNGPLLQAIYKKNDPGGKEAWSAMLDSIALVYPYIKKTFGPYPYPVYSFIQGGDGGMEYPMATLIKNSELGMVMHEWLHSWYQGMLGSNETLYPWMDEGFTSYAEARVFGVLYNSPNFWWEEAYNNYLQLVKSNKEEPLSTPADFYNTNFAYGRGSYSKGAVFLAQLGYIVGEDSLDKILLEYYKLWRFKHPDPDDFIHVAEKVSNMELKWYKEYFIYSTKTIDYAIANINDDNGRSVITLKRIGAIPMPIDLLITYKDGSHELHYIPMNLMYGTKSAEDSSIRFVHEEWKWTHPTYELSTNKNIAEIKRIEIDPSLRMADINRINNRLTVPE